jgi:hypothetical protein
MCVRQGKVEVKKLSLQVEAGNLDGTYTRIGNCRVTARKCAFTHQASEGYAQY